MIKGHVEVSPNDPNRGRLVVACAHSTSGECRWPVWRLPKSGTMWQWSGDADRPSIMPSIDCQNGCGRHFTMNNGEAS